MNLRQATRRAALVAVDAALVGGAFGVAYVLRMDAVAPDYAIYAEQFTHTVGWIVALHLVFFFFFELYRGVTRFAGLRELMAISAAATVSAAALIVYNFVLSHRIETQGLEIRRIPWSVIPLTWMVAIVLTAGVRYARRMIAEGRLWRRAEGRGALIVGAGQRGEAVARELMARPSAGRRPVGFIDDDPEMHGRLIHGLEIFGGIGQIDAAIEATGAEEVIVALPSPSPRQMKEIAELCSQRKVKIQRLPSAEEVLEGHVGLETLRPLKIEDLLGREPVRLSFDEQDNYLAGECVLVTGAGGSIGAELCRQILKCSPARLLLLGHGENSLYEIADELGYKFGDSRMELILADIQDERKMRQVFERTKPTVVLHAAAHKHVPFGEIAPEEVTRNNVFGTLFTARAAIETGVKRFILISTDKAVAPVNVLGASKRLAEMLVFAFGAESQTQFLAVRFGNVLGSRGSVIPLFWRQIESGGPLTVTDPEMTRYFMTIPEAASLVLRAGAIGAGGQLLVLDMGEPVKIADLARNMIALAGYEPDIDVAIEYVGARPGEKIHEELLTSQEGLEKTRHGKIFVTTAAHPDRAALERGLAPLWDKIGAGDSQGVRALLMKMVEDFEPDEPGE